jgi:hypothetical protein
MRALSLFLLVVALVPANAGAAQSAAEKSTAKRISGHIQQSGQLKNYRIGVTYHEGIATLAGSVSNAEQRDKAIALAEQCKGVNRVECKLQCADEADAALANIDSSELKSGFTNEFLGAKKNAKPASTQAIKASAEGQPPHDHGEPATRLAARQHAFAAAAIRRRSERSPG